MDQKMIDNRSAKPSVEKQPAYYPHDVREKKILTVLGIMSVAGLIISFPLLMFFG